ncbi:hypothetical protein RYX36_036388 [Vicia faba]
MSNVKNESVNLIDRILATDKASQVGVVVADELSDEEYDWDEALNQITISAAAELKVLNGRVEYLKSHQWLIIPSGLGINPVTPAMGRCNLHSDLITKYWQMTRMSYDRMKELMQQNTPAATLLAEIATLDSTPGTSLFADWGVGLAGVVADPKNVVDNVYKFVSEKAQMNFDVRDMGILNLDNMSVTDAAWKNVNDVTSDRLDLKINEYSMQQLVALNLVPCSGSTLAAWTRAYGIGCGIMPHPTSKMDIQYSWTISSPKKEDVEACMTWEKHSGKLISVICLNVLALFGLLHLNKDKTLCTNDDNMNRVCTSWLNTLHTITTKTMQNEILKQKEELCRIAALPFGLAQTYWLALVLGKRTDMLAPHLALRLDVLPPPVQRIMIVDSSQRDWVKFPAGQEVNSIYKKQIELVMQGVGLVRDCPPAYSEFYKLYGLAVQSVLSSEITEAADTLMPAVCGYAKSGHGDKGTAQAMCVKTVCRNNRVITEWWVKKWRKDIGSMKKEARKAY